MKKILASTAVLSAFFLPQAFAYLPVSNVTSAKATLYAVYTTSDPTCQTDLVATIPMTPTGQAVDFAQNPLLGYGSLAPTVNCVVFVLQNSFSMTWSPGTYTSTSDNTRNNTINNPDSVCDAGGSVSDLTACAVGDNAHFEYPAQVEADLITNGLWSSAPNGGGSASCASTSSVFVAYVSTNSLCTNVPVLDNLNGNPGCNENHAGCLPTTANNIGCGLVLTAPAAGASAYKLALNPSYTFGGTGASPNACGLLSPFLFSFAPL